jgi:hypothetical protein
VKNRKFTKILKGLEKTKQTLNNRQKEFLVMGIGAKMLGGKMLSRFM